MKIANQFEYEEDYEPQMSAGTTNKKKTSKTSVPMHFYHPQSSNDSGDGAVIKKHPLYRIYSPSNPVLKE